MRMDMLGRVKPISHGCVLAVPSCELARRCFHRPQCGFEGVCTPLVSLGPSDGLRHIELAHSWSALYGLLVQRPKNAAEDTWHSALGCARKRVHEQEAMRGDTSGVSNK